MKKLDKAFLKAKTPPKFPKKIAENFVGEYFAQADKFLKFAHKTPVYLMDGEWLKGRAAEFLGTMGGKIPNFSAYFAMKSNNRPEVAKTLLGAGMGLDVSSGRELAAALKLGAKRIIFTGPGKTAKELELAAKHADRVTVMIDSFGELSRLAQVAGGKKIRAGVRLTTQPEGLWRKFGIPLESLPAFVAEADKTGAVDFCGLHFHTSWNLTPKAQIDFIKRLGKFLALMDGETLSRIEFIDIGGGYWPEKGEWMLRQATARGKALCALGLDDPEVDARYLDPALHLADFADALGKALKKHILPRVNCNIYAEPGRWICDNSMHILLTVLDVKGGDLAICDGGTNLVGWERFELDYCPILNLTRPSKKPLKFLVTGSLCTPHDIWGAEVFGTSVEPGDVLLIPSQGAYTISLGQNFIKDVGEVEIL